MARGTTPIRPPARRFEASIVRRIGVRILVVLWLSIAHALIVVADVTEGSDKHYSLDIPQATAEQAIKTLSRQTGYPVIFQSADVTDINTRPLKGRYTLKQALTELFKGTALAAGLSRREVITISRQSNDNSGERDKVKTKKSFLAAMIGLLAGAGGAEGVQAQTDSSPIDGALEEIVVTAQFREQNLQDTPLAITAFTADMIEQRSSRALVDIANSAPSVVLKAQTAFYGPSISASIRGFGQNDYNPAFEPGVGIFVDDVYYARLTGSNLDLLDVERVEVLRGPQGTLTGKNSEGGAIRIVTRKPNGEGAGSFAVTYGSRDRVELVASADFGITEELSGRLSATYADQDGFVDVLDFDCVQAGSESCTKYSQSDTHHYALRSVFEYNPSDTVDILFSADYNRENRHNGGQVLLYADNTQVNTLTSDGQPLDSRFVCGDYCNYYTNGHPAGTWSSPDPDFDGVPMESNIGPLKSFFEGYGFSVNAGVGLTDTISLTSITAYRTFDSTYSSDGDLAPTSTEYGFDVLDHEFWSQELRFNWNVSDRLLAVFGAYYSDEETNYYAKQDLRTIQDDPENPLFPVQLILDDLVTTSSKGVFTTLTLDVTEALAITAGLRYTKDEKTYRYSRLNFDGVTVNPFIDPVGAFYGVGYSGPDPLDLDFDGLTDDDIVTPLTGRESTFKGGRTDYRLSADYRFSESLLAYGTIATGYKAGGVSPRGLKSEQARPFGPEELVMYELGVKSDFFDKRVRLNAAVFYNDFKGAQLELLSCPQFGGAGPCSVIVNAGDSTVQGVELELYTRPMEGLQIDVSASYLDWDWDCINPEYVGLAAGPCSNDAAVLGPVSETPPRFVDTQVSGGIQYESLLGADLGSLTSRIDIGYTGGSSTQNFRPVPGSPSDIYSYVDSHTLVNLRFTWRSPSENLMVALEATNITNEYYYNTKFDDTDATSAITGQPGRPREWAVTARFNY